jgi:DNA-binding NarL/FixJ family response regulator
MKSARVLIADDHEIVRQGIRIIVETSEGFEVCGEASDGRRAVQMAQVVRDVLTAGARGYVLKTDTGRDLISALELLLRGRTFFTSKVAQIVLDSFVKGAQPVSRI